MLHDCNNIIEPKNLSKLPVIEGMLIFLKGYYMNVLLYSDVFKSEHWGGILYILGAI